MGSTPGRAAVYCRLSRKGGRSVERQEQDGRKLAAGRGCKDVRVFVETESASEFAKKAREEWEALLAAVRDRQYDLVIVWLEDRSNRDVVKAAEFVQACRKTGTRLVIADSEREYDFTDAEDTAKFYGEVVHAQREVARLSKRVRRARTQEAEEGWRHPGGRRAFGERGGQRVRDPSKADDDPDKWLRDEHGRWLRTGAVSDEQVEFERKCIREAAERILDRDSLRSIVLDWNGPPEGPQRVPPANGGRWKTQMLRRLLLSPRLVGWREHHDTIVRGDDGEPVSLRGDDGEPVEPILPLEQWEAVRTILTDPARAKTAVGGVARHLLTGLCFCGTCKAKLRVRSHSGSHRTGRRVYYCPSPADGGNRCVMRSADWLEKLIEAALFRAVENEEWSRQAADRSSDDATQAHHEALTRIAAELDVLDRRIAEAEGAEELGGQPHPSSATLRRMLADREAEQERHQAAVSRLQHGRVLARVPRNLRQVWPHLSLDRRRAIIASVIERIEIHPVGRGRYFDPSAIEVKRRKRA